VTPSVTTAQGDTPTLVTPLWPPFNQW